MATIAVDTLKLARRLEAAGFPTRQAQDTAEAIADAIVEGVATKADVHEVRNDIRDVRADVKELELRLSAKIEQLRLELDSKLADTRAELLRWFVGMVGFQMVAMFGGAIAIVKLLPSH
jgi:hypothetical protein